MQIMKWMATGLSIGLALTTQFAKAGLGAAIFSENFNSGTLSRWTPSPLGLIDNWTVTNGRAVYNGGGHTQLVAGDSNWSNYKVQATFRVSSSNDFPGGLRGRVDSLTGRSYVAWFYPGQSKVVLGRTGSWHIDEPGYFQMASAPVPAIAPGIDHTFALSFEGDKIQVSLDGKVVLTTYDSGLKNGKIALDVSNRPVEFDDITVWPINRDVPVDEGPGGPILVIGDRNNPFSRYLSEILDAEGLRAYSVKDLSRVNTVVLEGFDVAMLDEVQLNATQVQMLTDWVQKGGKLIAMRPDPKLSALLGISFTGNQVSEGYLRILGSTPVGAGLTNTTRLQFHGTADRIRLATGGAVTYATLHAGAGTTDSSPAVTLRTVGTAGGQAAAFAFGLSRSIVLTRQGNPAWSGQERDGITPIRSNDLFYGASATDPKLDWVDFSRIQIPQADEQQRFLRKLISHMNQDKRPLPSFWYLPRKLKAAVLMSGDDHAHNGTGPRFNRYLELSKPGCSVEKWECIRGTSYVYVDTPLSAEDATRFNSLGFEVALHVNTGCEAATQSALQKALSVQLPAFSKQYPGLPSPTTNRNHCIAWANYASPAVDEAAANIRMDTNYYYYPAKWVQDRPGLFTGSGLPMRFAHSDGTKTPTYQAATQLTDESEINYDKHVTTLLDNALGPKGYYAVITANMHTDENPSAGSEAIIAAAKVRNVPVITAKQLLSWVDMRNRARFASIQWLNGTLTFQLADVSNAVPGLQAMVPLHFKGLTATNVKRNGIAVSWTRMTVKGVDYAFFASGNGNYEVSYQ